MIFSKQKEINLASGILFGVILLVNLRLYLGFLASEVPVLSSAQRFIVFR